MSRALKYLSNATLCLLALVATLSFISVRRRGMSWARQRRWLIEIDRPDRRDALRITKVTDDGQVITPWIRGAPEAFGQPFRGHGTWLKGLAFVLRNATAKTIAFAAVNVCFPETQWTGPMMCVPVQFGRIPDSAAYSSDGERLSQGNGKPLNLGPGHEMTISLSDHADGIKDFIEEREPFSHITSCYIHLEMSYFDDGMKWMLGSYWVPDTNRPGSQMALPPTYFPGVPGEPTRRPGEAGTERRNER